MNAVALRSDASADSSGLIDACRTRSIELLRENTGPLGVLAAALTPEARERAYSSIFARDAAICALGMAVSGDARLERESATAIATLAARQAQNGQIPKFVDSATGDGDFWYVGCIDATLWWLLAIAYLDQFPATRGLRDEHRAGVRRAIAWLQAQEHPHFGLLQQNEASDWADIMPRSGFVLYTNALWTLVKQRFGVGEPARTVAHANALLFPFDAPPDAYRRTRLLADYAVRQAQGRDLYLSFVNFSFAGDEGDVFGNVLATVCGLADRARTRQVVDALLREQVHERFPVRAVCRPIAPEDPLWRPYMARHGQNYPWQYHNGGIWPMLGGFWILALLRDGRTELARQELVKLARACAADDWRFSEWFHGRTLAPSGMPRQSWNAAAFLMADHAVRTGTLSVFGMEVIGG